MVEVYEDNFFEELERISELIDKYNYIGMDTEFPGDVYQSESHVSTLCVSRRSNANLTSLDLFHFASGQNSNL